GSPPPPPGAKGPGAGPGPMVRVFPNPWKAKEHAGIPVVFKQLEPGSRVRLYTLSGRAVATLEAPAGSAAWPLTDDAGGAVASGLYLYSAVTSAHTKTQGTFAVIR